MMTPEAFARLRAEFDRLCGLDSAEQASALAALSLSERERAQLKGWLDADAGETLDRQVMAQVVELGESLPADARLGGQVGPYRIEALLGAGGMGRVYLAVREDGRYEGKVAIKFVAAGADPRFFLRERQVLARLQHPGIARLIDAGEDAQGVPFLVMEYVDGLPLGEFCAQRSLDAAERIRLVIKVARAIAHAHALLILHRDLKPANLLVTERGEIKVLDFGIAKLLEQGASQPEATTARYFTLRYAGPEQLSGSDISTATDVHALAVILFELLCGRHPFEVSGAPQSELVKRTLAGEPVDLRGGLQSAPLLRDLGTARRRDLEALLESVLRPSNAEHRIAASALADDLQAILEDRPLSLRVAPLGERVARWLGRHRLAASALGIGALGLLVGVALALWQADRARHERDEALREADRAEQVSDFLVALFSAPRPIENQGKPVEARQLLDTARTRLDGESVPDPLTRVQLQSTLAETYRAIGQYDEAMALLDTAQATSLSGPQGALQALDLQIQRGRLLSFQAKWPEAEAALAEAVVQARALQAGEALSRALSQQVAVLLNLQRPGDARAAAEEALAIESARRPEDPKTLGLREQQLASVAMQQGDLETALRVHQSSVERIRKRVGPEAVELQIGLNNLAAIKMRLDRVDESIADYRESIRLAEVRLGSGHRDQALPLSGLGMALRAAGRGEEAVEALAAAVAIYRRWDGDAHPLTAYAQVLHAETLWLAGAQDEAAGALGDAAAVLSARYGPAHGQSCRAGVLQALIAPAAPLSGLGDAERKAIECVRDPRAPPGMQLMGEWAAQRGEQTGDGADAGLRQLQARAESLKPRDGLLQRAVISWVQARRSSRAG